MELTQICDRHMEMCSAPQARSMVAYLTYHNESDISNVLSDEQTKSSVNLEYLSILCAGLQLICLRPATAAQQFLTRIRL